MVVGSIFFILQKTFIGIIISSILQRRKVRLREMSQLVQEREGERREGRKERQEGSKNARKKGGKWYLGGSIG